MAPHHFLLPGMSSEIAVHHRTAVRISKSAPTFRCHLRSAATTTTRQRPHQHSQIPAGPAEAPMRPAEDEHPLKADIHSTYGSFADTPSGQLEIN